jgi:hypothetical protein
MGGDMKFLQLVLLSALTVYHISEEEDEVHQ